MGRPGKPGFDEEVERELLLGYWRRRAKYRYSGASLTSLVAAARDLLWGVSAEQVGLAREIADLGPMREALKPFKDVEVK